jgi:acyl-CoA reductase-like NAD-dependent aldehyde dehydrogenase
MRAAAPKLNDDTRALAGSALDAARHAQRSWGKTPIAERLNVIRRFRQLLAENAFEIAKSSAAPRSRPTHESLTAEVLPLIEACRFLEKNAAALLVKKALKARGASKWLGHAETVIEREPFGVVLIIGPGNYPLFLPGVQAVQALVAGNAVLLKPGVAGSAAAERLESLMRAAQLPPDLFAVFPESVEFAQALIAVQPDKVLFTGSATAGEQVLRQLTPALIPSTLELSGCDPVIVCAEADLDLVVPALQFGWRLNNGNTCIAPRRLLVHSQVATELEGRLGKLSGGLPKDCSFTIVASNEEAVRAANNAEFALGASVFTRDESAARALAARINAGLVTINDLILPSADPHIPFGGRKRSGFGVTRGAEGLLELTRPKVVTASRGSTRRGFEPAIGRELLLESYINLVHGRGFKRRAGALWALLKAALAVRRADRGAGVTSDGRKFR